MSWEDVARLSDLSQVNMELASVWLDDCINYSQEARKYLEQSGYLLKKCHDKVNHEAPGQRPEIPARRQQGKQ
jgi:hypothetical protein